MGLRAMHEANKQNFKEEKHNNEQESNLIEQQSQTIEEQEQKISELLSQISILKSEVQKLADKNVKLNEADEVLKQNEELRKKNEELKKERLKAEQEATVIIGAIEKDYEIRYRELGNLRREAEQKKSEAEATINNQNELISKRASEIYNEKKKSLEMLYGGKEVMLDGAFFGSLAYGILCTVFTAVRSERIRSDCIAFFSVIWTFISSSFLKLIEMAKTASQIGYMIPQSIVAFIVHWLILILIVILVCGVIGVALYMGIDWVFRSYIEDYIDNKNLLVLLVSLAISVFFAESIRAAISINLLLLLIIANLLFMVIRHIVRIWRERRY